MSPAFIFLFGFLAGILALYFHSYYYLTGEFWKDILATQFYKSIPFLSFFAGSTLVAITVYLFKRLVDKILLHGQVIMCEKIKAAEIAISRTINTADDYRRQTIELTEKERRQEIYNAKIEAAQIKQNALNAMQNPPTPIHHEKLDKLAASRAKTKRLESKLEKLDNHSK